MHLKHMVLRQGFGIPPSHIKRTVAEHRLHSERVLTHHEHPDSCGMP